MRKLPADLENPIDNFVYIIVDFLSPYSPVPNRSAAPIVVPVGKIPKV